MDRLTGQPFATRSEVLARSGVVATSQPLATQAALAVLRQGGTAVDAAISANAVLSVVEPTGCGLGGDLFAIVWDPEKGVPVGLNGSGRSPRDLTRDALTERGLARIPAVGPLSSTVPGCVDAWTSLHERFGRLPFGDLLEPAIEYAREGFPVSETIAHEWEHSARRLGEFASFREQFLPEGRAPRKGELFHNPNLARTLERIVEGGRDAFYRGEIAERIESSMEGHGGYLSIDDLQEHRCEWVTPVSTHYRGHEVFELPPNGQGIAVLQMLNMLERFDVSGMGFGSPELVHLLVEVKKLVYEDRARWYADPGFCEIPVAELISKEYAEQRASFLDPERCGTDVPAGDPALEHDEPPELRGDTVCLAVADAQGMMVSLLQSNYEGMGSGIAPDGLGFVLQNRGQSFDLRPGRFNTYEPGKRPFHTIIPAFVTRDGEPYLAFGVMGGATQPQAQTQVLLGHIDFGWNLQEAGDAPRVVHVGSSEPTGERRSGGGRVLLEGGFAGTTERRLLELGHDVARASGVFGGYQAVGRDPRSNTLHGASDARKDGHAAGY